MRKLSTAHSIEVVLYKKGSCYTPFEVIQRAISKLGEVDYHAFNNNCEHFAHWCKTGRKYSCQVNDGIRTVGSVVGSGLAGGLAVVALPCAVPVIAGVGITVAAGCAGGILGEFVTKSFTDTTDYQYLDWDV